MTDTGHVISRQPLTYYTQSFYAFCALSIRLLFAS